MKSFNTAPFIRLNSDKFPKYYSDFFIALSGPLFMAIFLYGIRAALITAFCLVTAVFFNAAEFLIFANKPIINPEDILTALIIPLLCPATINLLIPSLGVAVAVVTRIIISDLVRPKMMFLSSAAIGWIFLATVFGSQMFSYTEPQALSSFSLSVSSIKEAVPSVAAIIKSGAGEKLELIDLLLGELPGPMGTSSPIVILACAVFLIIRHSAPYQTVVGFAAASFVSSIIFGGVGGCDLLTAALFEVCAGSLLFCAVFMACQRHFYPMTRIGRWISGVLLGFVTVMLRRLLPLEQTAPIAILIITFFCYYFDIFSYMFSNAMRYLKVLRHQKQFKKAELTENQSAEQVTEQE